MVIGFKNQFNTTIKQLKIDYNSKTFQVGNFKMTNDKTITRKEFYNKIEELEKMGFKESR